MLIKTKLQKSPLDERFKELSQQKILKWLLVAFTEFYIYANKNETSKIAIR